MYVCIYIPQILYDDGRLRLYSHYEGRLTRHEGYGPTGSLTQSYMPLNLTNSNLFFLSFDLQGNGGFRAGVNLPPMYHYSTRAHPAVGGGEHSFAIGGGPTVTGTRQKRHKSRIFRYLDREVDIVYATHRTRRCVDWYEQY